MTTDATPAPERYEYAPIQTLSPSKTNPRKHITDDSVAELAESIKEHGVIEPLIVQDRGKAGYEIVAGERRFHAAKLAGLGEVPVIVRPFEEAEMFLVRLIENIQREDLNPLDLAAGYQKLIKDFGFTVDRVAETVHRKRRSIYATMQLLTLSEGGKKALAAGELSASVASLLARVPKERQEDAMIKLRGYNSLLPDATGLSVRHAEERLRNFIGTSLAGVPWKLDDAELLPEQGPCTSCQYNTKNVPDLAEMYDGADVCINAEGFKAKQGAQHKRDQEKYKDKGFKVLTAAESKKLTQYGSFYPSRVGFAALTEAIPGKDQTYSEVLKGKDVQVYVGRGPKGGEVKLVKLSEVKDELRAAGVAVREPHPMSNASNTPEAKAKREREDKLEDRERDIVAKRVHDRMPKVKQTPAFIPLLIRGCAALRDVPDVIVEMRGLQLKGYQQIDAWLAKLKPEEVLPVWLECEVADGYGMEHQYLDAILKLCGLPPYAEMLKDARKQAEAELKAEEKAPAAEKPKKSAKAKPATKKPAAKKVAK